MRHTALRPLFLLLLTPLMLVSCRDPKIEVYEVPKEKAPPPVAMSAGNPHPGMPGGSGMEGMTFAAAEGENLVWTAPSTWRAKGGSTMRKGSYDVGPAESPADLAITAFPGNVGGDLANVNRWRGQVQVAPIAEAELASVLTPIEADGLKILVTDISGGPAGNPQRLLGAIVPYKGSTWFFKMVGPDAVVAAEKPAYLAMLQTIKPGGSTPAAPAPAAPPAAVRPEAGASMASTAVPTAGGADLQWTAPASWQSQPAGGMRKATYHATGEAGATAELAVTAFPGDVGGELANVNRWRGQLQLPPITAAELPGAVSRLTVNGLAVSIVECTGGSATAPQRLLGAMVPVGGATWFFKFTGPPALIEREKPAFLAFIQTLKTP